MYKVGDKFEIEIEEVYKSYSLWDNAIDLYRIKGFNSLVFDKNGLDKLKKAKPYDVEDLAEAKREAYDRGYMWGVENTEKAYQAQGEKEKPKTVKASELVADTLVICHNKGDEYEKERRFAGMLNGKLYACELGVTSKGEGVLIPWDYMRLEDDTEVLAE